MAALHTWSEDARTRRRVAGACLLRAWRSLQGPPLSRSLATLVQRSLENSEIAASARRNDIIIVIVVIFFIPSEIGINIFSSLPAARKADVRDVVHRAHRADQGC